MVVDTKEENTYRKMMRPEDRILRITSKSKERKYSTRERKKQKSWENWEDSTVYLKMRDHSI